MEDDKEDELEEESDDEEEESEEDEESDEKEEDEDEEEQEEPPAPEVVVQPEVPDEKKEGEDEPEGDEAEQPEKEEVVEDDVQLPPGFLLGKADKLRRKSTAIKMKMQQRLEKLKSTKHRKFEGIMSREQEDRLNEREIMQDALLEWKLECHDKIQKYKEKIRRARATYKRRYEKQQKKIEIHVRKDNQAAFMQAF